jgi:hypothetical protein
MDVHQQRLIAMANGAVVDGHLRWEQLAVDSFKAQLRAFGEKPHKCVTFRIMCRIC